MHPIIRAFQSGSIAEATEILRLSKKVNHNRTPPSDEPLQWKADDKKLVRLDDAIMACHLMSSRITFKTLPQLIRQQIHNLKIGMVGVVGKYLISRLAGTALKGPKTLVSEISGFIKANDAELQIELGIRRNSIRVMRDLRTRILFQRSGRVRKTKLVFTRHETDEQRRPNRRWKSPEA